jgi:transposase
MARTYGENVRQAAQVLYFAGVKPAEIKRRLETGEAGLPFTCEPSLRTVYDWAERWKKDARAPLPDIEPGEEISTADAVHRAFLSMARRESKRLAAKEKAGTLTLEDIRKAKELGRLSGEIKRQQTKTQTQPSNAAGDRDTKPISLAERLRQEARHSEARNGEEQRNSEAVSNGENGNGRNGGDTISGERRRDDPLAQLRQGGRGDASQHRRQAPSHSA